MNICYICKKEIKIDKLESIYQLNVGHLEIDCFGGVGFEEAKSCSVHGYIHINCLRRQDKNAN